jgi:hypothetical protein
MSNLTHTVLGFRDVPLDILNHLRAKQAKVTLAPEAGLRVIVIFAVEAYLEGVLPHALVEGRTVSIEGTCECTGTPLMAASEISPLVCELVRIAVVLPTPVSRAVKRTSPRTGSESIHLPPPAQLTFKISKSVVQ